MGAVRGNSLLYNPHLEGDAFFWQAGKVGILLFHGFTATTAEVRPLAQIFHRQGYTVAAPLLPGHGSSPQDLNRTHWQDWTRAGQEALKQMQGSCQQVFVAGESMGGLLALYLASQNPALAGLLLYAPAIVLNLGFADYVKLYLGAPFLEQVPRAGMDCSQTWQGYPGLPLKGILQLLQFGRTVRAQLADIHQPMLVFQGRLDTTVAPQAGELLLSRVSSTQKTHYWLEKSHHTLILDVELEEVAAKSIAFMGKM